MDTLNLQIEGGQKLSGTVVTKTAKNSAVALLCASLLNHGTTTLKRVPHIEEVNRLIEVLKSIGVRINWKGDNLIINPPKKLKLSRLDQEAATKTRSILMFLGPLIHWEQSFTLPHPGGCKLGARSVRPHLYALENLGVKIISKDDRHEVSAKKLKASEIVLYEAGDTVTENAMMAAAGLPGTTFIKFATANYMVQDLGHFLLALGCKVGGLGTSTISVSGQKEINRNIEFTLSEDPIESMLFLAIAATTNSEINIKRCPINFLELELLKLKKMGFLYSLSKPYLSDNGFAKLVDISTKVSKLKALEEKIHPLPFPGINIDNLPFFVPIATQANGATLIHDWVYENRAIYYMELTKLGADIILADPYRVYIKGPTALRPAEIICPPALRPAALILIGMLAAKGTSILRNIYSINRGYEDLANRLKKLGAKIKLIK
ncbi:MAG: UDP-N-acetylglucosamine 1-carboxyvinyltransferase [Patescibacteria group bacterium]|nr:UDP-N-acetylglucosamine 1-carboxyvinyltransferase [Patescibacteria group bacterium]